MKRQRRLIVFEQCGWPELQLMRLLRLFGWSVSAVNFGDGLKPGPVQKLPKAGSRPIRKVKCEQELRDEAFSEITRNFQTSPRDWVRFCEQLSSAVVKTTLLAPDFGVALHSTINSHAHPIAIIRALLGDDDPEILLVTRSRTRQQLLKKLTTLGVLWVPFSDLPSRLYRSLRFGTHNPGSPEPRQSTQNRIEPESARVIFFPHKGEGFGQLYPWEQYFSHDPSSPCHPANLLSLNYQINKGSLYRPLRFTKQLLRLLPLALRLFRISRVALPRFRSHLVVSSIRLVAEVQVLTDRLQASAPRAELALLSYDMLTPPNLSLALKARKITRAANLERGNAHLSGLPILVDLLMVPNEALETRLNAYPMCVARRIICVGHWRTDYLFGDRDPTANCDVLVLPYHVDGECDTNWAGLATGCANFIQHLTTILQICRRNTHLSFVIRTKDPSWTTHKGLEGLVHEIETTPNLEISSDYSRKALTYVYARNAKLVIGRYSSIFEELQDYGLPVLIDNRGVSIDVQFGAKHLTLKENALCNSEDQLIVRADTHLNDPFSSTLNKHHLCDGHTRSRIVDIIESELESGSGVTLNQYN